MATVDPYEIEPIKAGEQPLSIEQIADTQPMATYKNQDLAKGNMNITDKGVFYTPAGAGMSGGDTVEGRLTGLIASESPYMQLARTGAAQTANTRGLLNSTMAATAGEKAAIESALPIAQQDAQYAQQRGLQEQQGQIQTGLYETQGEISKELSAQGYTQDMALKQADIEWNKLDLQARMDVETARLDQENKAMFNETMDSISDDFMKDYMAILVDPNFETSKDRQAAIDTLKSNTQQRYAIAAQIAKVSLTWNPGPGAGSEGTISTNPPSGGGGTTAPATTAPATTQKPTAIPSPLTIPSTGQLATSETLPSWENKTPTTMGEKFNDKTKKIIREFYSQYGDVKSPDGALRGTPDYDRWAFNFMKHKSSPGLSESAGLSGLV